MEAHMNRRLLLIYCVLGLMIGAFAALGQGTTFSPAGFLTARTALASIACTSTRQSAGPQFTGYVTAYSGLRGVKSSISYNNNSTLQVCVPNSYFWAGIVHNSSCNNNAVSIAQSGWSAWTNVNDNTVHALNFWFEQDTNCSNTGIIFSGAPAYGIDEVVITPGGTCSPGQAAMDFYASGSYQGSLYCANWDAGNLAEFTSERNGYASHVGAMGYWYSQYCTATGQNSCLPTTAFSSTTRLAAQDYWGYTTPYNDHASWDHFNACDTRDGC
jgi:hypothetical protein